MLKRVVLISALTSMGCVVPLMGALAQQDATDQGTTGNQGLTSQRQTTTPPGVARDQGSSAGQQGQTGTAAGTSGISSQHGAVSPLSRKDRWFLQLPILLAGVDDTAVWRRFYFVHVEVLQAGLTAARRRGHPDKISNRSFA